MKVYVVVLAYDYESTPIKSIFLTKEKATEYVLDNFKTKSEEKDDVWFVYKQINENEWRMMGSSVRIEEWDVKE